MEVMVSKSYSIPAGLSGIMDYSGVAVKPYPVKLKSSYVAEGKFCYIVVERADKMVLRFHIETNVPTLIDEKAVSLLQMLRLLEVANVLGQQLIYHK